MASAARGCGAWTKLWLVVRLAFWFELPFDRNHLSIVGCLSSSAMPHMTRRTMLGTREYASEREWGSHPELVVDDARREGGMRFVRGLSMLYGCKSAKPPPFSHTHSILISPDFWDLAKQRVRLPALCSFRLARNLSLRPVPSFVVVRNTVSAVWKADFRLASRASTCHCDSGPCPGL